jgi:lycopene beta-cyclase
LTAARPRLVIAGGGLAGCLAALALAARRPDVDLLLVEQGDGFGGNHIWSCFDSDVAGEDSWLFELLAARRWPDHEIHFPHRSRILGLGYNSLRSADLDRIMRETLRPDQYRLGRRIAEVGTQHVLLEGGERIEADGVIDARGASELPGLELGWQKFLGRTYRFDRPHGCARPLIMDARVEQDNGYRFVYLLPFDEARLMAEDTYYSATPVLDLPLLRCRLDSYLSRKGLGPAEVTGEETGVLPVVLAGEVASVWPAAEPPVARLGLRGGFFHPTTGYSLPDAIRNAALLAASSEFGSKALHDLFRGRAAALWDERRFYQKLNRMLFRAAAPNRRYRVLEHFYRLPEPLIARFYAGRLTTLDKLRILSGRPPVPVGRALAALRNRAA